MPYGETLVLFFLLLFGIIIVPGMDMLFVAANALTGGLRLGLAATAGITAGGAVHTLLGAVGVGILAHWLPSVLPLVLYAGAAYMAWIGWSLCRSTVVVGPIGRVAVRPVPTVAAQGLMTCLLNPKAYLFVFSVYPQFLSPRFGSIWLQALVLGIVTAAVQVGVYGSVAIGAARAGRLMADRPAVTIWIARFIGALFIAGAVLVVWHGWAPPPA